MNHVGIDVSKYKHDCHIATYDSKHSFSFENTNEGFKKFLAELQKLTGEIKIGFEITGHYIENLKAFLILNKYHFMELNAFLVKKFSESQSLRKTKTDKKDAQLISEYLMSVDFKTYLQQSYHISALKELTRLRSKLISERTKFKNMLTKLLDVTFPEFKPFFKDRFTKTALYILKKFKSAAKLSKASQSQYESIKSISMGKFTNINFIKLKHIAANSIGICHEFHETSLMVYLSNISMLTDQIEMIENQIDDIMSTYPTKISTIPGVGQTSAAIIIGEFGSIDRFDSPAKMLAFAGLEPSVNQSGVYTSNGKIVKRGSRHLRSALINSCFYMLNHVPKFYEYYYQKIQEGKHHRVALTHLARKFIRVIHHLEITRQDFCHSKLR